MHSEKMESKCVFTFLQVRSFTLMHRVCWSRLFRQIVGADAVSSADGASSPAKGDCAKSIGIIIATKNNDFRVIQCIDNFVLPHISKTDDPLSWTHNSVHRDHYHLVSGITNISFWQVFKRV